MKSYQQTKFLLPLVIILVMLHLIVRPGVVGDWLSTQKENESLPLPLDSHTVVEEELDAKIGHQKTSSSKDIERVQSAVPTPKKNHTTKYTSNVNAGRQQAVATQLKDPLDEKRKIQEEVFRGVRDFSDKALNDIAATTASVRGLLSSLSDPEAIVGKGENSIATGKPTMDRYDALILDAVAGTFLDPVLIKAMVWQESSFNPDARNATSSATGLMQMTVPTYKSMYPQYQGLSRSQVQTLLMDPKTNIEAGVDYIVSYAKPLMQAYDIAFDYHAGPATVANYRRGRISEEVDARNKTKSVKHAKAVVKKYKYLKKLIDQRKQMASL